MDALHAVQVRHGSQVIHRVPCIRVIVGPVFHQLTDPAVQSDPLRPGARRAASSPDLATSP